MRRHATWIAVALFAALVAAKFDLHTGFTSLIRFGETWQDRRSPALQALPIATVPRSNGYDGQFYAQLALDPLLRGPDLAQVMDDPSYRARRILVPATAALLGLARPWWTLQAYALLNVGCWLALAWILRREIAADDWLGFARWLGCMFSLGVLDSVRQSLVDLPALLLLTLAVRAWTRPNPNPSTLWLALGNLARETNLLGAVALHGDRLFRRVGWQGSLVQLVAAAVPLGLWSLYVHDRFGGSFATGRDNFTWPLLGAFDQARLSLGEVLHGPAESRHLFGLLGLAALAVQLLFLWRTPRPAVAWWRIGLAYSVLLLFLGPMVWSGYWAACRAVLPMTIAFNLLLPAGRNFWPMWILGNLSLIHGVWRFL